MLNKTITDPMPLLTRSAKVLSYFPDCRFPAVQQIAMFNIIEP